MSPVDERGDEEDEEKRVEECERGKAVKRKVGMEMRRGGGGELRRRRTKNEDAKWEKEDLKKKEK